MNRTKIAVAISAAVVCVAGYNISISKTSNLPSTVASAAEETAGPEQILDTSELMKLMVDPVYEDLKDAIETAPEKRKDWRSLYIAAFSLAELNNLNFSRTGEDYTDNEEWIAFSAKARDQLVEFAEAVRERPDYAILKEKFTIVMENCNECHAKFAADEEVDEIEPPLSWLQ
ncbi:MAG: hypothetical protein VCD00_20805 [Candidatus Hydrogenedentota bacterium]